MSTSFLSEIEYSYSSVYDENIVIKYFEKRFILKYTPYVEV